MWAEGGAGDEAFAAEAGHAGPLAGHPRPPHLHARALLLLLAPRHAGALSLISFFPFFLPRIAILTLRFPRGYIGKECQGSAAAP